MDWYCLVMMMVLGVVACAGASYFRNLADVADERRGRTVAIIESLVEVTGYQEPTRRDANDPLRDRLVFCGRWTDHGHAPTCPWVAAVNRVRPGMVMPQECVR